MQLILSKIKRSLNSNLHYTGERIRMQWTIANKIMPHRTRFQKRDFSDVVHILLRKIEEGDKENKILARHMIYVSAIVKLPTATILWRLSLVG